MINHFIDLDHFSHTKLRDILDLAKKIKLNPKKYSEILENKSLGMIFEKQSNRTRVSFNMGMQKMGGNVIELTPDAIGFGKRESISDVARVLSQYLDCLVIRNDDHRKIISLSEENCIPIINGLSNFSHPCQILSDIFTIEEKSEKIANQLIVWCGDINNVLISLLQAAKIFQFKLNITSPKKIFQQKKNMIKGFLSEKINFFEDPYEAVVNADFVMTDVWISMGDKSPINKNSLFKDFQVNNNLMKLSKKDSFFMHCLPAHRNQEVTDSVIDSEKSIVWLQAKNRMFVQQSILNYCIS